MDIAYAIYVVSQLVVTSRAHNSVVFKILVYLKGARFHMLFPSYLQLRVYLMRIGRWYLTCSPTIVYFLVSYLFERQEVGYCLPLDIQGHGRYYNVLFRYLISDIGIYSTTSTPLYCNNLSAIYITSNPMFYGRTKLLRLIHLVLPTTLPTDCNVISLIRALHCRLLCEVHIVIAFSYLANSVHDPP